MAKHHGSFFLAGLLGAIAGIVGGLLLAPKSGKTTRKDIVRRSNEISKKIRTESTVTKKRAEAIFGKASEETLTKYSEIKNAVVAKLAAVKTAGTAVDKDKYAKIVDEVVKEFKSDLGVTKASIAKIATYLKKDWDKVKKALV